MTVQKYNKASMTVLAGAVVALITNFWPTLLTTDAQTAVQTLVTAVLVYVVANR